MRRRPNPKPGASGPPEPEAPPEENLPPAAEDILPPKPDAPEESLPPAAAPPAPEPAPVHPEAERRASDGRQVCSVCLRRIGPGETYVHTPVRGAPHLEPCSHQA